MSAREGEVDVLSTPQPRSFGPGSAPREDDPDYVAWRDATKAAFLADSRRHPDGPPLDPMTDGPAPDPLPPEEQAKLEALIAADAAAGRYWSDDELDEAIRETDTDGPIPSPENVAYRTERKRREDERKTADAERQRAAHAASTLARLGARHLRDIPWDAPTPRFLGRLDPVGHTVLFGTGGVGKGVVAAWWDVLLVRTGHRVLIVDYENHPDEWSRRIGSLGDAESRSNTVHVAPLVAEWTGKRGDLYVQAAELRELADIVGATFLIIDSAVTACAGQDPTDAATVSRYAAALQLIGRPALSLAHVPKAEGPPLYPFGSVFWHNLARSTWSLERAAGDRHEMVLVDRKANNFAKAARSVLRVEWVDDLPREVSEVAWAAVIADEVASTLTTGALTVGEIVAAMNEERDEDAPRVKADTVRHALRRGLKAIPKRFTVTGTGPGAKWSLVG